MGIRENLEGIRERMARACERSGRRLDEINLVAVSKGASAETLREAFSLGLHVFGESRVQEAAHKMAALADLAPEIAWHMVGHLQTNKAKLACRLFGLIQSVDSVKLARVLSGCAGGGLPILLQVNVSGEAARSGFAVNEVAGAAEEIGRLPNLSIAGLMTIAPLAGADAVRRAFADLCRLRDAVGLRHLSMGMSDDFEIAIEEGATMLRIGRAIFGQRR